ncbi:hypothetical protein GCM10011320_04820 [Neoroseomonas lacus]|uniref:Uncharacterized protein n=1 Tax=Neoroseomonas lacus TaxID=287609 RepID=A0A917K6P3_9PROT|nr:hypothetical protein GCM10011320_04820 [Neoroseomonas lacus]
MHPQSHDWMRDDKRNRLQLDPPGTLFDRTAPAQGACHGDNRPNGWPSEGE